jgi:hypothetical protein
MTDTDDICGDYGGDVGTWVAAEATVRIDHAR